MEEKLAYFLRSINGKLITTNNLLVEKILKLFFAISVSIYRNTKRSTKISSETIIDNFDSDIKMSIDKGKQMGAAIYWTGFHEFREFIFLHRFLKPNMIFVDVGANQGEYTLFAAKRLRSGKVLAFEPLPSISQRLKKNIVLNNLVNVDVFELGLAEEDRELPIYEIEDIHEGLATLYPEEQQKKQAFLIKLVTLDETCETKGINRIDFIKLDIEGGELNALRGATSILKRDRPALMIEINERTYNNAGYTISEVKSLLDDLKYRPYQIGKRGKLEPAVTLPTLGNVVFLPS
jgi:FkbM family methyltransferase